MGHGVSTDELRIVAEASGGPPDAVQATCEQVYGDAVASATVGIWRFRHDGWSVVVKVLRHQAGGSPAWQSGGDEDDWYYWRREALMYSSGLLDELPGLLRPPRCFGVFDRPDGSVAVWLEDLGGAVAPSPWPLERYGHAASALGYAQGAISRAALPDHPWLTHGWLRRYVERREHFLAHLDDSIAWATPLVARSLRPVLADASRALWDDRDRILAEVESSPQTLCHLDLHPANVRIVGDEVVLIDWAFAGIGAMGEDAGNLVYDAVLDFHVAPTDLADLADVVYGGYLEGLAAAGWDGDAPQVRATMQASAAVKFFWILPAMLDAAASGRTELNHRPIEETFTSWVPVVESIARQADPH